MERVGLYPNRVVGRRELPDARILPFPLVGLYQEILSALGGNSLILTGIGIRMLIEAVCKDRKAKGSNLISKIDNLVEQHVLTQDGAQILHRLRFMGNKAAHEAKAYKAEELYAALDVAEHLLSTVYIIPKKIDHLPERKKAK